MRSTGDVGGGGPLVRLVAVLCKIIEGQEEAGHRKGEVGPDDGHSRNGAA